MPDQDIPPVSTPGFVQTKRKSPIPMAIDPQDLFGIMKRINGLNTYNKWYLTAFSSFLYLTGARVSEGLMMKRGDIDFREDDVLVANLRTLKARIYPIRQIPIVPTRSDKPFYRILKKFLDTEVQEESDLLFPTFKSRFVINHHLKKIKIQNLLQLDPNNKRWLEQPYRMHPHYLRHCRLSHMTSIYGYGEIELMRFAGWSSTKPCVFYVKLNYKDLLKKMVSANIVSDYVDKYLRTGE